MQLCVDLLAAEVYCFHMFLIFQRSVLVSLIFVILVDISNFGASAQNFETTDFEFNSNVLTFLIPFVHCKML